MTAAADVTVLFDGNETAGWNFGSGSTVSYVDGHAVVVMGEQSNGKYRADINYTGDGIEIDPSVDKVFAIQFIGERPSCNISFEIYDPDLNVYFGKNNFQGTFTTDEEGNQVVYVDATTLSKNDYVYGEQAAFTTNKITYKIADASAPTTYTVGWIKTGESLNEILGIKPAVVNNTTGDGYDDLEAAFNAATEGDELVINHDIQIGKRLTVPCKLTITGANKDIAINRNFGGIMMLVNAETTFSNITLSSKEGSQNNVYLEVNKVLLNLDNVVISNVTSEKNQGIIALKQGGKLNANGLTFTNCAATSTECPAVIFIGSNGQCTLGGEIDNASVYRESTNTSFSAGENLSVNTPITICVKDTAQWEKDAVMVNNSTNPDLFALTGMDNYELKAVDGNLVIAEKGSSSISDINAETAEKEYYDLMGRKVVNPSNGIYVVREGKKVYKVAL